MDNNGTLNNYFQPLGAPVSNVRENKTSAFDFGQNTPRDAVTSTKIKNFSFNQGTGGTLTLGGTNNGRGELVIENSLGEVTLVLNSGGINGTQSGSLTNNGTQVIVGALSEREYIPLVEAGASGGAPTSFYTSSSTPQGLDNSRFALDPDDFPSNTFYLEAVYRAGTQGQTARTLYIDLYDITGGTPVAGGTFIGTTQSGSGYGVYPRERSTYNFGPNLIAGTRDYMLRYWAESASGTLFVDLYTARLILDF